jgi:hypothetical protein
MKIQRSNVLDNGKRRRLGCNTEAALLTDFYQLLLLIAKKQFAARLYFVCLFIQIYFKLETVKVQFQNFAAGWTHEIIFCCNFLLGGSIDSNNN